MGQRGRPPFILSDADFEKLLNMVRIQCTEVECCEVFGVTHKTLNAAIGRYTKDRADIEATNSSQLFKRYSHEGRASLRRMQWKAADKGNATMLIWLGKQMLGQKDQVEVDNKSSDGSMSPAPMTKEELLKEVRRRGLPDSLIED